jgi:hypothetical protein
MTLYQFASAHPEAAATFLSVFAAVFVGFLGYRANRARHKREYTLSVLSPLLTIDSLFGAHHTVVNYRIADRQPSYEEMDEAERESILRLLGYYEFLSASFLRRDLDRGTVLRHRRSTFGGTWTTLKPFILTRRELLKNDKVYRDFELFVRDYCS